MKLTTIFVACLSLRLTTNDHKGFTRDQRTILLLDNAADPFLDDFARWKCKLSTVQKTLKNLAINNLNSFFNSADMIPFVRNDNAIINNLIKESSY